MLSILFSVSKIFRMDFGTVLTVWYFSFQFILPRDVHLHVSFFFTMWYWINIYCCVRWPHWNKILFLLIHYWRARAHSRCKYWKMTNGQLHITWILFSTKGEKGKKHVNMYCSFFHFSYDDSKVIIIWFSYLMQKSHKHRSQKWHNDIEFTFRECPY